MEKRIAFKKKVIEKFIAFKQEQLEELKQEQKYRLESANLDDIDHGDLVESPKEQMMDEINLQAEAADQLSDEILQLQAIDPEEMHYFVSIGALVKTNVGYFLIAASHAPVTIDGKKVTGISAQSPLFQKMKGLSQHAGFHLGNVEYVILDIV